MKKIFGTALTVSLFTFALQAQEIPQRKNDGKTTHERHGKMHHRPDGMLIQKLNLTDAQKEQLKTQQEIFRKQMTELKKNENITVKEWKTRMENLRKEQKNKIEGILTQEQKAELEKLKAERKAEHEINRTARIKKMKIRLGLTDEQSTKIEQSRTELAEKMKAIRENKTLSNEKKREEIKELIKKHKENAKSVLTEEQLKKLKNGRRHGPHKKGLLL